jgi:hypothetical protein
LYDSAWLGQVKIGATPSPYPLPLTYAIFFEGDSGDGRQFDPAKFGLKFASFRAVAARMRKTIASHQRKYNKKPLMFHHCAVLASVRFL